MSQKRLIRNRTRSRNKEPFHLELNSLLDVLVILLVFLIKNYTTSEVDLKIPKGIMIPISESISIVRKGVTVQVSKEFEVFIENKLVGNLSKDIWDNEGREKVRNELISIRDGIDQLSFEAKEVKSFSGVVNLIMDRSLEYENIKKLMDVSSEIGFEQFKFIVIES